MGVGARGRARRDESRRLDRAARWRRLRARARRRDVRRGRVDRPDGRDVAARDGGEAGSTRAARRAPDAANRRRCSSVHDRRGRAASSSAVPRLAGHRHRARARSRRARPARWAPARGARRDRGGSARPRAGAGDLTCPAGGAARGACGAANRSRREGPHRVRDAVVARGRGALRPGDHGQCMRLGVRGSVRPSRGDAGVLHRRRARPGPAATARCGEGRRGAQGARVPRGRGLPRAADRRAPRRLERATRDGGLVPRVPRGRADAAPRRAPAARGSGRLRRRRGVELAELHRGSRRGGLQRRVAVAGELL